MFTLRTVALVLAVLGTACEGDKSPAAPTPAPAPVPVAACVTNNTAAVTFENRSLNSTYTVVWNGSSTATLGPSAKSQTHTEAAGVAHSLIFKYANSVNYACAESKPVLTQCSSITYWCTY
jgi:hypothetical protein